MSLKETRHRFIITSLPRCGSTSLAGLLNCHPEVRCLIEPFHPSRYEGKFNAFAENALCLQTALELIWKRWTGFKHVWESNGWPFANRPDLNDAMLFGPDRSIILLQRRNLLRRVVSNHISRQTGYWIGTKAGFLERLDRVKLQGLNTGAIKKEIDADRQGMIRCKEQLILHNARFLALCYEDVFSADRSRELRFRFTSELLEFLGIHAISIEEFSAGSWESFFDATTHQWASPDIYRLIPGIDRVEQELGSDDTGWLFH